ncbi:MAG: GerMN domain-containing protein [Candidatus Aminicenantes bacterium]|nr:GerMN domain-containing protein [Candidatus Aminicenantes bacterium]
MTRKKRMIVAVSVAVLTVTVVAALLLLRKKPAAFEPERVTKAVATEQGMAEFIKVKLFFLSETSAYMRPVQREVEVPEIREELYRKFVSLLLAGDSEHITPAPGGTQLRSLFYLDSKKMLVLDFNERLNRDFPSGSTAELQFIYFLVDNLCYNFREIEKVQFLVDGNESKTLSGHIDLENPFYPDFSWLKDE